MTSLELLEQRWPYTTYCLRRTFFTHSDFGKTGPTGQNDAGFMLAALARFESEWTARHAQKGVTHASLDTAAGNEIDYQYHRGRHWDRPVAALAKCIQCLTFERVEKVCKTHEKRIERYENAPKNRSKLPESDRRGHDTVQHDLPMLSGDLTAASAIKGR